MAETNVPSSFIPHDTGVAPGARRSGGGLNDLLLLCAIVLFVASAALGVGVFLYQQLLVQESTQKLDQLGKAEKAFQPKLIQEYTRLDDRMHAADAILSTHIAPSAFFSALQQATLQTISFQTLNFQDLDSQHITIKMAGIAQSVNSIALQADLFSKNGVIASPIFSNIARQQDGVHFNLTAIVNPSAINYAALARGSAGGTSQEQAPAQGTPAPNSPFGNLQQGQAPQQQSAAPSSNAGGPASNN